MATPSTVVESFEFRCLRASSTGAILALTSAPEDVELEESETLREYIFGHAELLYHHANATRRGSPDNGLYIITGCLRSENWAMAAFITPMEHPDDTLILVKPPPRDEKPTSYMEYYTWTHMGSSQARSNGSGEIGLLDQSLFLRGFKLDFSQEFLSRTRSKSREHSSNRPGSGSSNRPDSANGSGSNGFARRDGRGSGAEKRGPADSSGHSRFGRQHSGLRHLQATAEDVAAQIVLGDSLLPPVSSQRFPFFSKWSF